MSSLEALFASRRTAKEMKENELLVATDSCDRQRRFSLSLIFSNFTAFLVPH